jgi:hypothetical protein
MPGEAPPKNVNYGTGDDEYPAPTSDKGVAGTGYNYDDPDIDGAAAKLAKLRDAGALDLPNSADIKKLADTADREAESHETSPRIRTPWVITCQAWLEASISRHIILNVNPGSVTWNMPIRASEQKTKQGAVLHTWRSKERGTYYDDPSVTINFQSGNIMPIRVASDGSVSVPQGVKNFFEFLELVDQDRILPDGRANMRYITYSTVLFPNLVLGGFFEPSGPGWGENAENPYAIDNWTATFKIYTSYPPLRGPALIEMYRSAGKPKFEGTQPSPPSKTTPTHHF